MMDRWKEALVPAGSSIQHALESISNSDLRIALIVDDACRLTGVIADGDIRRGLLRGIQMDAPVEQVMNPQPLTAPAELERGLLLDLMKRHDVMHIPLVREGRVVGLAMLQDFFKPARRDNPVCLMAGGMGRRLRPLTEEVPKPLLKIGNKPILESVLENLVQSGFHRFYISVHYKPEQIVNHFGAGDRWNVRIDYLKEDEPLGTGGALGLLPETLGELPLIVMNGDLLTRCDFARVLHFHEEQRAAATVCVRDYQFQVPFGVVQIDDSRVTNLVEKPVQRFLINAGMYVLDPSVVRRVPRGRAMDMPALLQEAIAAGDRVACFPLHEYWLDIGRMSDFEAAQSQAVDCP